MELIILSARKDFQVPLLDYFVNNGVNLTAPDQRSSNLKKANSDCERIMKFLTMAKAPFHQLTPPCSK